MWNTEIEACTESAGCKLLLINNKWMEMEKFQYIQFHISNENLQKALHQQPQLHSENNLLINWPFSFCMTDLLKIWYYNIIYWPLDNIINDTYLLL